MKSNCDCRGVSNGKPNRTKAGCSIFDEFVESEQTVFAKWKNETGHNITVVKLALMSEK